MLTSTFLKEATALTGSPHPLAVGSATLTLDKRGNTHNSGIFDFVNKLNVYGVFYSSWCVDS